MRSQRKNEDKKDDVEFVCPEGAGNGNFADPATCRRFYQVSVDTVFLFRYLSSAIRIDRYDLFSYVYKQFTYNESEYEFGGRNWNSSFPYLKTEIWVFPVSQSNYIEYIQ